MRRFCFHCELHCEPFDLLLLAASSLTAHRWYVVFVVYIVVPVLNVGRSRSQFLRDRTFENSDKYTVHGKQLEFARWAGAMIETLVVHCFFV